MEACCPFKIEEIKPGQNGQPMARSGHRSVSTDRDLWIIGGFNPRARGPNNSGQLLPEVWRFNFASQEWTRESTMGKFHTEVASHAVCLFGNNIIVFGGSGIPFGEVRSNTVSIFNIQSKEWSEIRTTGSDKPPPEYGSSIFIHGKKLLVLFGTSGFAFNSYVHCLNLETFEWTRCDRDDGEIVEGRFRQEVGLLDNRVFVFGGGTSNEDCSLDYIPVFDLSAYAWSIVKSSEDPQHGYPSARKCHGCVQIGQTVYIIGGLNAQTPMDDIWAVDLKRLVWRKCSLKLPSALFFHSASVTSSGCLYIFGGALMLSSDPGSRSNKLYKLWLKISPLREICWEIIAKRLRNNKQLSREALISLGIPHNFIARI